MLRKLIILLLSLFTLFSYAQTGNLQNLFVSVNGHKIHYYKLGNGRAMVLLTGYGVTSNFWSKDFITCLSKNHTVYLFDYSGVNTGENPANADNINLMANDVHAFINQLKLNQPDIVAWSMGGAVSIDLVNSYPSDVGKVTLISPLLPDKAISLPQQPSSELKSNSDILNYVFNNNLYRYDKSSLSYYESQIFNRNGPLFTTSKQRDLGKKATEIWVNDPKNLANFNKVKGNMKFILADHDTMLDSKLQTKMIDNSSQIIMVNSSGHAIFYQQPNLVCWFTIVK